MLTVAVLLTQGCRKRKLAPPPPSGNPAQQSQPAPAPNAAPPPNAAAQAGRDNPPPATPGITNQPGAKKPLLNAN